VWTLVSETNKRWASAIVLLSIFVAGLPIVGIIVASIVIGRVAAYGRGQSIRPDVALGLLILPALLFFQEVSKQTLRFVGGSLKRRTDFALQHELLDAALLPRGISHLENAELASAFATARNLSPFGYSPGSAVDQLSFAIINRLQPLFAIVLIAFLQPVLALFVLLVWLLMQLITARLLGKVIMSTVASFVTPEVAYLRDVVLTPAAAKEVRIFGLGRWLTDRVSSILGSQLDSMALQDRDRGRLFAILGGVVATGLAFSAFAIAHAAISDRVSLTTASLLFFAVIQVFIVPDILPDIPLLYGMMSVPQIRQARSIAVSSEQLAPPASQPAPTSLRQEIAFRDVHFLYPDASEPAIQGLDLRIRVGERLGLVGSNGAGKTTLVKLLARLYEPTAGQITADGVDLCEVDTDSWRTHLAVLFQDFIRYPLPVLQNISLGAEAGDETRLHMEQALNAAAATAVVTRLPSEDAPLSATVQGGVDLSGGEWQRIALARTLFLVLRGARILILDEPTANLDAVAEQTFFDSVLRSELVSRPPGGEPITTLLITHRFATVRHCDRIAVIEGGRVIEEGSHDELMVSQTRYAEMFNAQARTFETGEMHQ